MVADLSTQARLSDPATLVSIYFGGGTPSLTRPEQVARLIAHVRALWPANGAIEVTLEANPDDATPDRFASLAEAGVNRLSLGVQSFDDGELTFLKRNHNVAQARAALDLAVRTFPRVSLDLIYALPGQTPQEWGKRIGEAARMGVAHLSAYQLTVETGTPLERAVRRGAVSPVAADLAAAFYNVGLEAMAAEGFEAYEVSNFARSRHARSRHNLVYWRGEAYAAVGPGAHGRLSIGGKRTATEGERGVDAYVTQVAETGAGWRLFETLSVQEVLEERVLMGLRTDEGVAISDLTALGRAAKVGALVEDGWLERLGDRLRATRDGRLVLDSVTRALLA